MHARCPLRVLARAASSFRGETGPATGWFGRAQRLLERDGQRVCEHGYLLLPARRAATRRRSIPKAAYVGRRGGRDRRAFRRGRPGRVRPPPAGPGSHAAGAGRQGLALLDEAMVAVTAGELSPLMTGLIYCSVIEGCQQVYALDRAREWTSALSSGATAQPQMVAFTGSCLVHRAEIMQLHGAWRDAIEEARRACYEFRPGGPSSSRRPQRSISKPRCTACEASSAAAEEAYRARAGAVASRSRAWPCCGWPKGARMPQPPRSARVTSATTDRLQRTRLLPAYVEIMLAAGDIEEARGACRELEEIAESFDTGVLNAMAAHARGAVELAEGDARGRARLAARRLRVLAAGRGAVPDRARACADGARLPRPRGRRGGRAGAGGGEGRVRAAGRRAGPRRVDPARQGTRLKPMG